MPDPTQSDSPASQKRPSKAAKRIEAFHSVRAVPMRPRTAMVSEVPRAGADDHEEALRRSSPGPDYLAAKRAYRERLQARSKERTLVTNRWSAIGPSGVRKGQGGRDPVISGRVSSLAVTPDSSRVYVGAANGGVWRSEDGGETWDPLMEAFDLDPEALGADSLAVGALALVPGATASEDVLYVGSGEAIDGGGEPTSGPMFGVGPIVSTDGGLNWHTELRAPGGPWSRLVGNGFYELAVDPSEPTRVFGATRTGLFRREPSAMTANLFLWRHIQLPNIDPATPVTAVVAAQASGSGAVFYAACMHGPVFRSNDGGDSWQEVGTDFPADAGRVRLAVEASTPDVVYAFTEDFGLYRLDVSHGSWSLVERLRQTSTVTMPHVENVNGRWNLAIAVAPGNANRVYVGGGASSVDVDGWLNNNREYWAASLFRFDIDGNSHTLHYIGASLHPDVHAIVFPPGDPEQMWVGCDGGAFYTANPPGDDGGLLPSAINVNPPRFYFQAKNTGLQTLMMHHLGQHPTEPAVLFGGTQDNGCLRYTGEPAWLHSYSGDCGFVVVHEGDPYRMLAGLQLQEIQAAYRPLMVRSNFGGNRDTFDVLPNRPSNVSSQTLFYYPLVGTPSGSGDPGLVAFGSLQPWISENFGRTWRTVPSGDPANDALVGPIRAIAFASADRFFVGTHSDGDDFPDMGIYRFDRVGSTFERTRLDFRVIPPSSSTFDLIPFEGTVSDIAIDWADPSGASIYVAFGGYGSFGHVWHHDGFWWRRKDGNNTGGDNGLLDVAHNAIVVDPQDPQTLYVGSDLGVWRSHNAGDDWHPFSENLPDATVVDLKLHPKRLLRASTHGRGVFERRVDNLRIAQTELFIRDTQLDLGYRWTEDGLDHPLQKHAQVWHWKGPDIKLDFPDSDGRFQLAAGQIPDFLGFTGELRDDGLGYGQRLRPGDVHRVYAQIHNRGHVTANGVEVTALITHATGGLPSLPWNYESRVRQGQDIENDHWQTLGRVTLDGLTARTPKVAGFEIPQELMPPPSDSYGSFAYSVLILVHHPDDAYPLTPWQPAGDLMVRYIRPVDEICKERRLAAVKSVTQQRIVVELGELEEMEEGWMIPFTVAAVVGNPWPAVPRFPRLRFELKEVPGRLRLFMPPIPLSRRWLKGSNGFELVKKSDIFERWAEPYMKELDYRRRKEVGHLQWTEDRMMTCKQILDSGLVVEAAKGAAKAGELILDGLEPKEDQAYTCFLWIERTEEMKAKPQQHEIRMLLERPHPEGQGFELAGGQTVQLVYKPKG